MFFQDNNFTGSSANLHASGLSSRMESHTNPGPEVSPLEQRVSRFGRLGRSIRDKSGKALGKITASGRVIGKFGETLGKISSSGKIRDKFGSVLGRIGSGGKLYSKGESRIHSSSFGNDSKSAFMSLFKK
jgi:hypothetical protein